MREFRRGEVSEAAIPLAKSMYDLGRWLAVLTSTLAPGDENEIHLCGDFLDEEASDGMNPDLFCEIATLLMGSKVPPGYWAMLRNTEADGPKVVMYRQR